MKWGRKQLRVQLKGEHDMLVTEGQWKCKDLQGNGCAKTRREVILNASVSLAREFW